MSFNGEDGAPTRRSIFDVDALLKSAPTNSEVDAAQEVPYGLSRAIFVAPSASSPGADMSSSLTDLVSVADPKLIVAIQRITGMPRLRNEAAHDRSEESAIPSSLTTLPRSEAAAELAPHGVTVNVVAPATIDTDIMGGRITDDRKPDFLAQLPVGRLGTTRDVAAFIEFLLGADAGYITGATYNINGGLRIG